MGLPITARGYSWTHADRDEPAVGPLDLEIPAGQKVLLLGPSGAGKSTLLHALAGVLPDESGTPDGQLLVGDIGPDPHRGDTGLVLQDPESQVIFSRVGDDVAFGMENLGLPAELIDSQIRESLTALGLDLRLDHPTAALSGGQKQRLALAGIHAMSPQVIILDEPTANIDAGSAGEIRDAVLSVQAASSATMVVVEHRVGLWLDHVDRVIVLGREGLVAEGPPRSVFSDPELSATLIDCGIWVPTGPDARTEDRPRPVAEATPGSAGEEGEVQLRAESLAVSRPRAKAPAAAGIDLTVRAGQAVGIIGPNGAGKSTTALTLAGLLPEFAGRVAAEPALRGKAKQVRPFAWPSALLAPRIGMVFQEPAHQFLTADVASELRLGPHLAGWSRAEVDDRVAQLLDVLGLDGLAGAHPQSLSGGEKRRLSVAAMLAPRPQVLIVDEPTFGQDALTWAGLVELFLEALARGSAVVAVSHDHAFLEAIGAELVDLGAFSTPASAQAQAGGHGE